MSEASDVLASDARGLAATARRQREEPRGLGEPPGLREKAAGWLRVLPRGAAMLLRDACESMGELAKGALVAAESVGVATAEAGVGAQSGSVAMAPARLGQQPLRVATKPARGAAALTCVAAQLSRDSTEPARAAAKASPVAAKRSPVATKPAHVGDGLARDAAEAVPCAAKVLRGTAEPASPELVGG